MEVDIFMCQYCMMAITDRKENDLIRNFVTGWEHSIVCHDMYSAIALSHIYFCFLPTVKCVFFTFIAFNLDFNFSVNVFL